MSEVSSQQDTSRTPIHRLMRLRHIVSIVGLCCTTAAASSPAASQSTPFRVSDGFRQDYEGGDWTIGTYFLAHVDLAVFALGLWLPTGSSFSDLLVGPASFIDNDWSNQLASSYDVGLYNDGMIQMGMVTIRPDLSTVEARTSNGQVWYTPLAAPLQMLAGQRYYLLTAASAGSGNHKDIPNLHPVPGYDSMDLRLGDFVAVQGADHITHSDGLSVPGFVRFIGPGRLGPNMLLTDPITSATVVSPEPSTVLLLAGGLLALGVIHTRRRRDRHERRCDCGAAQVGESRVAGSPTS